MFIAVRQFRYFEKYDRWDDGVVLKRYILAKMSFEMDEVRVLGADHLRLRPHEEAQIQIAPTSDEWIPSAVQDYYWTLEVQWIDSLFGVLCLPVEAFDAIAQKVLAGQVDNLSIHAKGGFWVDENTAKYMPERVSMTRYLRPGKDGRTDRPDSAVCKVTGLQVKCGVELVAEPTPEEGDSPEDKLLGAMERVAASNVVVANVVAVATARTIKQQMELLLLLAAIFVLLAYIAIWK